MMNILIMGGFKMIDLLVAILLIVLFVINFALLMVDGCLNSITPQNIFDLIKYLWGSGNIYGKIITIFAAIIMIGFTISFIIIHYMVTLIAHTIAKIKRIIGKYCFPNKWR